MENIVLKIVSIMIIGGGIYIYFQPATVAAKIKLFYQKYPFQGYISDPQLNIRPAIIKLMGVVVIIVGVSCFVSL